MDGTSRLGSASPEAGFTGNYQNGPRGYLVPTLGRSSSLKWGADRSFSSAKASSRTNASLSGDVPSLSQFLMLDPILTGEPKYGRTSELKKLLSSSVSRSVDDYSSGGFHSKNPPPGAVEELRRIRASVAESCVKATVRAKKLDEHLSKFNRFVEGPHLKKHQRSELSTHERSGGSTPKSGSQIQRNPSESGTPKHDDRPKNGVLNKRLRTSIADSRSDSRNIGVMRQSLMLTQEKDMLQDINEDSEMIEEKIQRLPAGGEGWDKKMKRKRSVGAVVPRSVDNEAEIKRNMPPRQTIDTNMQYGDSAPNFRSGAPGGSNELDPVFPTVASAARPNLKMDQQKSFLTRDIPAGPLKEQALGKLNVKLNNRDEYHGICPSPVVKGKASRTPRSGSANSPANTPRPVGTLESWEQPQGVNKMSSIGAANNRKRSVSVGSTSPPITQWGGQRPQKISRTRRTNLVPVSNNDEMLMQGEGYSPSDFSPRISVSGPNASFPKNAIPENQNCKINDENVRSPVRFSESEESGAAGNRMQEKLSGSRDGEERSVGGSSFSPTVPMKKNNTMMKEGSGDIVKRQGRNARPSPFSRATGSPSTYKVDNSGPNKPPRNARFSSEKSGSKSGRSLKKITDRKSFSRNGQLANECSSDGSGETYNDQEELLTAANLARCSAVNACSSTFWKTVEPFFASIGPEEKSFLSQQMNLAEESYTAFSQNQRNDKTTTGHLDDDGHEEITASDFFSSKKRRCTRVDNGLKLSLGGAEYVKPLQSPSLYGSSDAEQRSDVVSPLYQRVLSALILEEEIEELEETGFGISRSSVNESCVSIDSGSKHGHDIRHRKDSYPHVICPCNGYKNIDRNAAARLCNGELLHIDGGYVHSEVLVRGSQDDNPHNGQLNNGEISCGSHYDQMCLEEKLTLELQSIGLFLEAVPALDDKEDDLGQEMAQLETELHGKLARKRACLDKIQKAIQQGTDTERNPEQVAMDNLVELAYKKLLATKASYASEHGIPKVPKQTALSFAKRTVTRCRKFEETSVSSFKEPTLREIVYSTPPRFSETELLSSASLAVDGSSEDAFKTSDRVARNGPTCNRSKKKEVLLDDVSGGFRSLGSLGGGAKGKRSERDLGRNTIPKSGRVCERKQKSKPKQKTAQLGTELANNSAPKRKDVRFISSSGNNNNNAAVAAGGGESLDFDVGIDDLGIDGAGDLNSLLNFEGLQDHDSIGLEIPMDDLTELNMFC